MFSILPSSCCLVESPKIRRVRWNKPDEWREIYELSLAGFLLLVSSLLIKRISRGFVAWCMRVLMLHVCVRICLLSRRKYCSWIVVGLFLCEKVVQYLCTLKTIHQEICANKHNNTHFILATIVGGYGCIC